MGGYLYINAKLTTFDTNTHCADTPIRYAAVF